MIVRRRRGEGRPGAPGSSESSSESPSSESPSSRAFGGDDDELREEKQGSLQAKSDGKRRLAGMGSKRMGIVSDKAKDLIEERFEEAQREEQALLQAEVEKNLKQLQDDLAAGLRELLELHNSEELRTLCVELKLAGGGSKKANVTRVLALLRPGSEEKDCRRVVQSVWDGIVIEYLRGAGKNLMKCRDNLRGAVLDHWKRHSVALAGRSGYDAADPSAAVPVFMRGTPWKRRQPTSSNDVMVIGFLEKLHPAEAELKDAEKCMRAEASYAHVVAFLGQIHAVRNLETKFRDEMLSGLQEMLGERDVVDARAKESEDQAAASKQALEAMRLRETAVAFFRGLEDAAHEQRVLENIRTNVQMQHRLSDIARLERSIVDMTAGHKKREGQLLEKIDGLEEEWEATSKALEQTAATLETTAAKLETTSADLEKTTGLFEAYRRDAQAFVDSALPRQATLETSLDLQTTMAAAASAEARRLGQQLHEAHRREALAAEEMARWRMHVEDACSRVAFAPPPPSEPQSRPASAKRSGSKGSSRSRSRSKNKSRPSSGKSTRSAQSSKSSGSVQKRGRSPGPKKKRKAAAKRKTTPKPKAKRKGKGEGTGEASMSPTRKSRKAASPGANNRIKTPKKKKKKKKTTTKSKGDDELDAGDPPDLDLVVDKLGALVEEEK